MRNVRTSILSILMGAAVASPLIGIVATPDTAAAADVAVSASRAAPATATPIKHLVVIFQENMSFDHYFGTYPHATNPAGEPQFRAAPGTPSVNGLTHGLLTSNPNALNSAGQRSRRHQSRSASIAARRRPPTRITTTRPSSSPSITA